MGHRFSKTVANNIAAKTTSANDKTFSTPTTANITPILYNSNEQQFVAPTINLQIQEIPTACSGNSTADSDINQTIKTAEILQQQQQHQYNINNSISNNLTCGRQIIIKIQLAKMENGNETSSSTSSSSSSSSSSSLLSQHQKQLQQDISFENLTADCNLNSTELTTTVTAAGTQFLNLTLNSSSNSNSMPNPTTTTTTASITTPSLSSTTSGSLFRTAGSFLNKNNNYLNSNNSSTSSSNSIVTTSNMNERPERSNSLQFNSEIAEQNNSEIVEYCEVMEDHQQPQTNSSSCNTLQMMSINEEPDNETNVCCRRKSKSLANNGGSSMSSSNNAGAKIKSRCRKCSCREAFRRFLDPSLSRSPHKASKQQKDQKHNASHDRHSISNPILNKTVEQQQQEQQQQLRNSLHSNGLITNATSSSTAATTAAIVVPPVVSNQISLWDSATNANVSDVIIPLTRPVPSQFVVVQCAIVNTSSADFHPLPTTSTTSSNLLSIAAQDITPSSPTLSSSNNLNLNVPSINTRPAASAVGPTGPIVHSQVDFVHYLVPDLEHIINSSFYWGKMDRYEAERLLEGKPEGTFLLRDSAQEEFLFSVTFRKYGRSLHARIEQSDHRFSFDCHDPCVFTAPTVTGLLEHYKDPACVMFFEPMLTIPLHRKNCFSLQKLCRATIVSNTTYDGINELELPARLKSYLKEYHYKQKLRVKSNEPTYALHCK